MQTQGLSNDGIDWRVLKVFLALLSGKACFIVGATMGKKGKREHLCSSIAFHAPWRLPLPFLLAK